MRIFFLSLTIILLELFTFMVSKSLYWLVKPLLPNARTAILIASFVVSNAMLATLFLGHFRFGMGWLAVLWLAILAMIVTFGIGHGLRFLGQTAFVDGLGLRVVGVVSFMTLLVLSVYNAYTPTVRHLTIKVDKPLPQPVTLALTSDLHLGRLFGSKQLHELAHILEREQVDALLMAGDIMDDDTHIYEGQNMKTAFEAVVKSAKGKVVASLGNHDLYNESERFAIATAIKDTGTLLLDDKVATLTINGSPISFIGRFDDHAKNRLPTAKLVEQADTGLPTILLDHRPSQIDENVKHPIDLQVSGHTHNGQVFPANFIVKAINRIGYGYEQINGTHVVVSSGYGFWGIPFRLGSQSEVWVIKMTGNPISPVK